MTRQHSPTGRKRKAEPEKPAAGQLFAAMAARKLIGCFAGPEDLSERHSLYLKSKLRGRTKRSR